MNRVALFVDDEKNVLNSLRRALHTEPYEKRFAQSPDEAFDIIEEEPIDLIVSDHIMPGMDGLTFLKHVRKMHPDIVRIILTGQADLHLAMQAINEGEVYRFLTKPWNDLELRITLSQVFDFIDLLKERNTLMNTVRQQQAILDELESEYPGIVNVSRDENGRIVVDEDPVDLAKYVGKNQ